MLKLLSLFIMSCTMLLASVEPLHVEVNIYKNISFMTKKYTLGQKEKILVRLPFETTLENIDIKTKRCKIESLDLSDVLNIKDSAKEKLKLKISHLNDKITTLQERGNLLKSLSLKDGNLKKAKDILKFFTKNYIENQNKISSLQNSLLLAKKRLDEMKKQKRQRYKSLKIDFSCQQKAEVDITYPEYSFRTQIYYVVNGDTENSTLDFFKKLKIVQNSGEDYKKIDIISHSNSYSRNLRPKHFYPRYLDSSIKKRVLLTQANFAMKKSFKTAKYVQNITTSSFVLKNIKLFNNQEKIVTLEHKKYHSSFQNDIDGYGTKLAYLRATFKSDKYIQNSKIYIRLNENQIGTTNLKDTKKNQTVDIYFGNNQNIVVKKTLLKRYSQSKFFGSKQTTTQTWLYKIQNLSNLTQKINLLERIPVSQSDEIKVEPLFDTTKAKISKKGKVVWSFELKPNQSKMIKFGYKITKPKSEKK